MRRPIGLPVASTVVLLAIFAQRSVAASSGDTAYAPPPLALYGQLPTMQDPVLSPAGDRLACLLRQGGHRYIVVTDVATGKPVAATRVDDAKVRALRWYDGNRLLILYSTTSYPPFGTIGYRNEWYMLSAWDIAANRVRPIDMHDDEYETMNVVTGLLDVRNVNGDPTLFVSAISPVDHADEVTVPVLLIHGRDDVVVPYAQSEEMAKALERAHKSVQLVSLPHEDHWLSRSATRAQMLDAVVAFLERNDPAH